MDTLPPRLSLETDSQVLVALCRINQWDLSCNVRHRAVSLMLPSWSAAESVHSEFKRLFSRWVIASWIVRLIYKSANGKTYQAFIGETGEMSNQIQIGPLTIDETLYRVLADEIWSHPEKSRGLVRLRDNAQLVCNGGADGSFLRGNQLEEVTTWKREDYWFTDQLDQFNSEWRQSLEVNGSQWFEFSYDTHEVGSSVLVPTARFTNRFRLVQSGAGELFHLCENVDMQVIAA